MTNPSTLLYRALARLGASVALSTSLPALAVEYSFTDLGAFVTGNSRAEAINNAGQVVGRRWVETGQDDDTSSLPVLWEGVSARTLPTPSNLPGGAEDINEFGQVVGFSGRRAVLWNGGIPTLLPTPASGYARALGINNFGQVVGEANWGGSSRDATLWNPSTGTALNLSPSNPDGDSAYAINDSGLIGGAIGHRSTPTDESRLRPTLWNGTAATPLPASEGVAHDINQAGIVVGQAIDSTRNDYEAVVFNAAGMVVLDGEDAGASGINNRTQIVGWTNEGAALWNGIARINLNEVLSPSVIANGWRLDVARDINDSGWIVGSASNIYTAETHAFLLTPVPEPQVAAMLLVGLGLTGAMHRRRRNPHASATSLPGDCTHDPIPAFPDTV